METNELRRGNIVLYNNKIIVVNNIFEHYINVVIDNKTRSVKSFIKASEISPVPITTKLLPRLGLKWNFQRYQHNGVSNLFIIRRVNSFILCNGSEYKELTEFTFMHQIQNIFKDLFNIDLVFKN